MNKHTKIFAVLLVAAGLFLAFMAINRQETDSPRGTGPSSANEESDPEKNTTEESSSMNIEALRQREYPGGDFAVEQALSNGTNYRQFLVSYFSEGLKIYGLLTIPLAPKPENGYPAVVFVHGHIPPKQYSTISSYPTYQAALARGGFVTFKPDLRGHGNSEGEPASAHFSESYVVDVMHAISYLKMHKEVDPGKIGYWGHSNGGEIGLRTAVITKDIKASVLWAGVVGSFEDMLETYNDKIPFLKNTDNELIREHDLPSRNPEYWSKIDPYSYLNDISIPIQLHHGTNDSSVPVELSIRLKEELEILKKDVEYFEYAGDDHNISQNSGLAWQRTIAFFKENLSSPANSFVAPLDKASDRITKKRFGDLIDPASSPVRPEKFAGYHTGVDFEIFPEELSADVSVRAVCTGELVQKNTASGYGGLAVQACQLDGEPITVIYGHLKLSSITSQPGESISAGNAIGILGADKSIETSGERKHLHLGFHKGSAINIRGYVDTRAELGEWADPCPKACQN